MDTIKVKLYSAFVMIMTGFVALVFDSAVVTVGVIGVGLLGLLVVGNSYEMPMEYAGLPRAFMNDKFAVFTNKGIFSNAVDGVIFDDCSRVTWGWPVGFVVTNGSRTPMIVLDRHGRVMG